MIALIGWMFDIFEGQIFVASMNEAMPSFLAGLEEDVQKVQTEFYNNVVLVSSLLGPVAILFAKETRGQELME